MSKLIEAMPAEVKDRFKALKVLYVSFKAIPRLFDIIDKQKTVSMMIEIIRFNTSMLMFDCFIFIVLINKY
jgi:hypothetical protein